MYVKGKQCHTSILKELTMIIELMSKAMVIVIA